MRRPNQRIGLSRYGVWVLVSHRHGLVSPLRRLKADDVRLRWRPRRSTEIESLGICSILPGSTLRNIFDQYSQPESHMTHAFPTAFNEEACALRIKSRLPVAGANKVSSSARMLSLPLRALNTPGRWKA
jgi:hypothetical protein